MVVVVQPTLELKPDFAHATFAVNVTSSSFRNRKNSNTDADLD